MDLFVFLFWFLLELSSVFWNMFVILMVVVMLFSSKVRLAFGEFFFLVFNTAWNARHVHWHKTVVVGENDTAGHLTVTRVLRCRCGSVKTRTEVL